MNGLGACVLALLSCAVACVDRGEVLEPARADTGTAASGGSSGTAGAGGEPGMAPSAVFSSIAVGTSHSVAVSSGRIYAWGLNDQGELGLGDTTNRRVPTALASGISFVSVSASANYTCALDDAGSVYCFGANESGQLGQGDREERHAPARVALPVAARAITSNFGHVCALLADATLYCWGRNFEGELGQNDSPPGPNQDANADDILSPIEVPGKDWSSVSAGDGLTCGVRFDGTLWCWGRNTGHQLGGASSEEQVRHPLQVGSDTDWLRVESGQQFSFALKQDHSLWCWGTNVGRATGDGFPLGIDTDALAAPTRLGSANDWVSLGVRVFHTCAVNRASELWCWGRNIEGQLGTGDTAVRETPTRVALDIAEVAVSWFTTCARTNSGHVLCTGANDQGEIGDGTTERPLRLTDVTPPAP